MARRAVLAVAREAIREGAVYLQELVDAPAGAGQLEFIETENGERVAAKDYVFACGPWLPKLFPDLLCDRISPSRQEVFFFGAWTAYQLQRSGKRVVLIDSYGAGNSRSSSGGESRIIRMGYGADEIYTRSALRSLQLWRELFARIDQRLFHQTGVLWLAHV